MENELAESEAVAAPSSSSSSSSSWGCTLEPLRAPAFFTCTSGTLLWGQVHTILQGATSATLVDTPQGPQDEDPTFRFRVPARKGLWTAEAAVVDDSDGEPWHVGFVARHASVDGTELLRRAAEAGIGGSGTFGAVDIVFVDRYDWSGSHTPGYEIIVATVSGKEVDPEVDPEEDEVEVEYYRGLVSGRFMLMDADGVEGFVQGMKAGTKVERTNSLLRKRNGEGFGVHLVLEESEYDMGWIAFHGGEIVGFVYDGAYSGLEGENLRVSSLGSSTALGFDGSDPRPA